MGRFRSLIAQSPAIVISVLAAAVSLGGGAYASTHLTPGPSQGPIHTLQVAHSQGTVHNSAGNLAAGVSWNPIVLQNGWISSNSSFASGNPKVALQSNVVYLSGSLHQSSGSSAVFGFLPSTFRPTHNMDHRLHLRGYLGDAVHRQGRDHGALLKQQLQLHAEQRAVLLVAGDGFLPDQLLAA
jgi:hypothetical protein